MVLHHHHPPPAPPQDRVSQTICLGWLQTTILLISAYWVARIIGLSHWHQVYHGVLRFHPHCIMWVLHSIIWVKGLPLYVYMSKFGYRFIHWWPLRWFHLSVIMNCAAVNSNIQMFVFESQFSDLLDICLGLKLLWLTFPVTIQLSSTVIQILYIPTSNA
jgi:hypothetical protein